MVLELCLDIEVCGTDYDTNTTLLSGGKECYCISYT